MFNRILVAIDGSQYSGYALPAAIELASKFHGSIFAVHVSEHDRGRAAVFSTETPAEATRLVADAVKAARDAGVTARGEVHDVAAGHTARNIVDTAAQIEADLIVMGSRGLSDVQGLLLGSVTHKVMQLAQTPVLVVRGPARVTVTAAEPAPALVGA